MADHRQAMGVRGELAVAAWLQRQGWQVLGHRVRSDAGELDLVCRDPGGTLVGVEVKLRSSERAGSGVESVGAWRVARLRRALAGYAAGAGPAGALRIDLVTLSPREGRWLLRHHRAIDAW